jgi:hypothetical protein
MPLPTDFDFRFQTFPREGLAELYPFYERLPLDPYIDGQFRRRRFSHFLGHAHQLHRLEHMHFLQSRAVNQLAGGIKREFDELEEDLISRRAFQAIVASFINVMGIDPTVTEMGVHQIRILCSPEFSGAPAPEGIHQDGFDHIGIFCIQRYDVRGANTQIYRAKDEPPIFSRALQPGEVVYANDRKVFHYADPVSPSADHVGYWDLIVITA